MNPTPEQKARMDAAVHQMAASMSAMLDSIMHDLNPLAAFRARQLKKHFHAWAKISPLMPLEPSEAFNRLTDWLCLQSATMQVMQGRMLQAQLDQQRQLLDIMKHVGMPLPEGAEEAFQAEPEPTAEDRAAEGQAEAPLTPAVASNNIIVP